MHSSVALERGVTLATHSDVNKLFFLNYTMELWPGPVSVCVFIHSKDLHPENIEIINNLRIQWGYRLTVSIFSSEDTYPINILRNRAAQKVKTELLFMIDLNFLPDAGLYHTIMDFYDIFVRNSHRAVFVIPVFQVNVLLGNSSKFDFSKFRLPETKKEVVEFMNEELLVFRHWENSQVPTDYPKWVVASEFYRVKGNWHYEPYIVVSLKHVPLFDESYIFYGDDTTRWHRHLSFLGFEYWVIPTNFIIHLPHKMHMWAGEWDVI